MRVGIVGAGPSGLGMAYQLSRLGIRDITVFDRAEVVGGQSVTLDIDGVSTELGTCYLAAGYLMAASVMREVGCNVELLPPATVLDESGRELERDDPPLSLIARYLGHWLRWYGSGQMWRPAAPDNALRFDAWLRSRDLSELSEDFTFSAGLTAQLYGPIDAVTAHSGMTWMRPSLFVTGRLSKTYRVAEGFGVFWRRLAAKLRLDLQLGREVAAVTSGPEGPGIELSSPHAERRGFDVVYVACPLDALAHPLREALDQQPPFEASAVYSAIWRARGWPSFVASRCYLPAARRGLPGRVLTVRRDGETGGVAVGQLCAYAEPGRSAEDHRAQMLADLERYLGLTQIELIEDRVWRYNIRYSPDQLRAGVPAIIDAHQGRGGVWYGGGALSHWNVDSIVDGSQILAGRIARQLGLGLGSRVGLLRPGLLVRDL